MLYLMSIIVCGLLSVSNACSPEGQDYMPRNDDLVGKTYYSHAVVMGRIVNITPTPMLSAGAYTVTMQVDCVIKDTQNKIQGDTPVNIDIPEAGFIEGMCHSAMFTMGHSYIAFLKEDHSGLYKPWDSPAASTPENQQLVMTTCGIHTDGHQCPAAYSGECTPDVKDYAGDQPTHDDHAHAHGDEHGDEHHDAHDHHGDEDAGLDHGHDDHHPDGDFDHDHDHSDHHHDDHDHDHDHEHDHHDDEDSDLDHSHADHHPDGDFDHDHDHSDHHHDHDHHDDEDSDLDHSHTDHHPDGEYDHDHDHSEHHDAHDVSGRGHRDVMCVLSAFLLVVLTGLLQ